MPIQAPQWTEFLACPVCTKDFNEDPRPPISLGCGHTICKLCLSKLSRQLCPYDQTEIHAPVDDIPINHGLLQLLIPNHERPEKVTVGMPEIEENQESFDFSRMCIEDLAKYLLPFSGLPNGFTGNGVNNGKMMEQLSKNAVVVALNNGTTNGGLTRPMQRKLVTLVNCQLIEEEGRCKAIRATRSLGERTVKELILLHQNPQHLSTNLWTAVRNRGCQFLGPAMQEEVLKLILLALEDGNSLSRKVLVLFVVQKLESKFTQASKTSIGHVVQLLYRASCFKVTKREGDSSLLQLHEKFRTYSALRKEHDAQVVQIAMEAGLHISPEQWSALLYGDDDHKSHMQSIIDKLQTPASFSSSIQELIIALQRTQDPADLQRLREDLERLADIDPSPEGPPPTWEELRGVMESLKFVVNGLVDFTQNYSSRLKGTMEAQQTQNNKYKTSMCRDILRRASCPRGSQCSFAHTGEELEKFRKKKGGVPLQVAPVGLNRSGSSSPPEATGTPNGLENGMNGSRESPDEIIRNGSNGTQSIPVLSVTDSMQNGAYYKRNFANVNYQRLPVQPEPQVNSIPVTYLPAAVQQMQPARTMYANGNEQPLGVYYSANQNSYIQAGMMLNANEQQCMPMGTQQYLAYYAPQYRFPHATGRGTHEKDKDSSDLDKGCVSRDIITENIRDDLKLDTGRSSCSLFSSSKNDFIWRDSCDKIRGSSIGSGLDTSSEYSPETFSPLSNESCGSPQSSQMQSYGSTWNQFDPYHQSSKEGRDLSQHPALSPLNGLAGSTIWSQGVDGDVFPDKSLLKTRSYPKTDWDQRMFIGDGSRSHQQVSQAYRDLLMTKKDDDDKPVGFNYSGDTQSSFEEASSEDLGTSRYSEWSYNELKRVGAPPGLQQAPVLQPAPIGTPAKSKAHHYNGKVHERGEFPRAQSRRSFPSISSLDGIALD